MMRLLLVFGLALAFVCGSAGAPAAFPTPEAERATSLLWIRDGHLTRAGAELVGELNLVEKRGLRAADYGIQGLQQLAKALDTSGVLTAATLARFDAELSTAAAWLASDLHLGRVSPAEVGYDLDIRRPGFDVRQAVESLAASPDVAAALDALEPQLHHYTLLKQSLARYRELAETVDLGQLPAIPRRSVRPGEAYAGAGALRRLLTAFGDLREPVEPAIADSPDLDPALVAALTRFQSRHGLDEDGVLGRATYRALTTPMATRIQQIELSLERVRWLPPWHDSPPIIVNIPQFRLFAFRTGRDFEQDMLQMDVIVGADFKGRHTPVFAADMRFIVVQPYWDVPRSILVKELLPDILSDPQWIDKNGYEIVRGQSDDAQPLPVTDQSVQLLARGTLRLRQKPGPKNALGHVKFMFPNRHNVYLHDTPARELFSRSRRAFSHGCIRVSDPMALLAHVMRDDPTWNEARRDEALASPGPVRVPLPRPIRVFILYGTALASEAGETLFFDDIYAQDAPLAARLAARRSKQ